MNLKEQKEFAMRNGWARIGIQECEVEVPLNNDEKLEFGKSIAESNVGIQMLEDELSEIKGEYKNKIDAHKIIIKQGSEILKAGKRPLKRNLPCFLDSRTRERIYIDEDTGEMIMKTRAEEGDFQEKLIEEDVY